MTDWRPGRTLEHRGSELGFAVRLVDAFTGERLGDEIGVSLAEGDVEPVRNPSGYLVFMQLPDEAVTLVVDGGDGYFDERRRIVLSSEASDDASTSATGSGSDASTTTTGADELPTVTVTDRADPVVVELTPTPAYDFDDSATTVRGHVETGDGEPIEGATVALPEFDITAWSTETGEYALLVPVSSDDVVRADGKKYVRVADESSSGTNGRGVANGGTGRGVTNGGTGRDPALAVTHPSHADVEERIEVVAGTRTVHYVTLD